MYHDMLDFRKSFLNGVMYLLRNVMRLAESQVFIGGDFKIHIDFAPELSRAEYIYLDDTILHGSTAAYCILSLRITGMVYHVVDGFTEDVYCNFEDK